MRFSFPHSHAFPGGRVGVDDAEAAEGMCMVEFGDGVTVVAEWHPDGDGIRLDIPAYRTARGTGIDARSWQVMRGKDGHWRTQRQP